DGYICYTALIDYVFDTSKNTGTLKIGADWTDCTFTYDSSNETWTSDYGIVLGLCSDTDDITTMSGMYEALVPSISIRRRSASTDAVSVTPLDAQSAPAAASPEDAPLIRSGFRIR
ncbi:MAG: hypothetical protein LUC24_00445, partial [Bacteroidales bacterium]|nr:hypothetical protein [Bacteroidales bacterium]